MTCGNADVWHPGCMTQACCAQLWCGHAGRLLTALHADTDIVNCVAGHPYEPLLASSGIENSIKMWEPRPAGVYSWHPSKRLSTDFPKGLHSILFGILTWLIVVP